MRAEWERNRERIFDLFPVLAERRRQLAGTLSGGEQQMLAIGRGIACDHGYVLETGRVVLEGPHRALMADDRVRRAYLGM